MNIHFNIIFFLVISFVLLDPTGKPQQIHLNWCVISFLVVYLVQALMMVELIYPKYVARISEWYICSV